MTKKTDRKRTGLKKTGLKKSIIRNTGPDKADATKTPLHDSGAIKHYHAHVYYDPATSRGRAERLRERAAAEFSDAVRLGRWHDELVGPHPQSMYQIAFPSKMLKDFVPWLMLNRNGLTILLHPETGDDYADHTAHAAWFGTVLPLRVEVFERNQSPRLRRGAGDDQGHKR